MALVVGGFVAKRAIEYRREEGSSDLYLEVDPEYLDAYDVKEGDKLIGKILGVGPYMGASEYPDLEQKAVSFIVGGIRGRIYLSERDWLIFRDRGLVKSGFWLEVKLSLAMIEGREVEIYSNADVRG